MALTLKVNEIFLSIQGEGTRAGLPCVLVRLAGCNLRCAWCDTQYAWDKGCSLSLDEIMAEVARLHCARVEITGGEPLIQPATPELIRRLCNKGCEVLLETNGSLDISVVDPRAARIVDFKCPSSRETSANRWQNVQGLTCCDEVKFVMADRADFEFARDAISGHRLADKCTVIFSPVAGRLGARELAEWILAEKLDVRLGVQLHKMIWPSRERGV